MVTTVAIGLDGGNLDLIKPWIKNNELPNLARAIEEGLSTQLISELPPTTSPSWRCYATGKNPGKIGIFWWENVNKVSKDILYPDHRKRAHLDFWEHMSNQGEKVGTIGTPLTYPPKPINGFEVSGAPDAEPSDYTYPEHLEEYLTDNFGYKPTSEYKFQVNKEEATNEVYNMIDMKFNAGKDLMSKFDTDFMQISTFYLNSLHHYYWRDEKTLRGWKAIDKHLGYFIDNRCNVIIMSDHGSNKIKSIFHINNWLEENGYLDINKPKSSSALSKMGFTASEAIQILKLFRIYDYSKKRIPQTVKNIFPTESGVLKSSSKVENTVWGNTTAIASGQGPIYLFPENSHLTRTELKENITMNLKSFEKDKNIDLFDNIYDGDEIYSNNYPQEVPDLVVDQSDNIHIPGTIGSNSTLTKPTPGTGWQGENRREGILVATGPQIEETKRSNDWIDIPPVSILDLAPTLLHLHDCKVPADMDGQIREDILTEDIKREPTWDDSFIDETGTEGAKIRSVVRKLSSQEI